MKKLLILFLLFCEMAAAQDITVLTNEKVLSSDSEYYFPHLSPDGNKIIFTTQNFIGLNIMDIDTKEIVIITDKQGAGYNPVFSKDGTEIFYRWNSFEGMKKYSSIHSINLRDKRETIIVSKKRNLSIPQINNNKLVYSIENKAKEMQISEIDKSVQNPDIWTCIESQKLVIYENNDKIVLTPKGEGNYIWPQLSPDKTKLLFTFAGRGTYISDLSGNVISDLAYLNAPKWLSNNWVVGMKDIDNGNTVTSSEIYAVSADGQKTIQLTQTDNIIKMYPDCSAENSKIVYHTLGGDIYLMTIKFN